MTSARPTRRRGAALDEAILQATIEELHAVGFRALTMDAVAARAGTSKNVIYRRWPSRGALCVAAYLRMLPTDPENAPDTGSIRSDALALLQRANERMSTPVGQMLRELIAGIQAEPEPIRDLREQASRAGVAVWLKVLARAVSRGEVDPSALTPRVATVAVDLLRNEYSLNGARSVPDAVLVEIVDQVYLPLLRSHG
ncbi:TetR/AcrR family transcriptional regulator [Kribbella pittospori]|uniref:TetR/AcrR family transcriptional regulator n=1 Tax=Kribbella pittospori TaxID=722689 RepID=A0A4R0KU72_9ACTN|nr:TetR/AcrR family transcriptional regulator [Kribbella pittospori]TCC64553.1 TetR/AcrR family transcriptional regulator [Kribbella pittospori]